MELTIGSRLKHAFNAFMNRDPTDRGLANSGSGSSIRPDRPRFTRGKDRTIVTAICNRIAIDVAAININHCRIDNNGRYVETINSSLNNCLNVEANTDQTGRAFKQDIVMSMLDEGVVAIVPIDTSMNPTITNSYDILTLRTGKVIEWFPNHVTVRVYNERKGYQEDIKLPKKMVAIVENPLYAVMNEPNSIMQRLVRKLSLLDEIDEQSGSGKLNMIIQLPYVIKSDARKRQAEDRTKEIEEQLTKSKFGIAYADGTEKIIQLNRALDNNLMNQIEYLTNMVYSQLGISQSILDGSANEQTLLNYNSRTIEPIVSAIVDEMTRKFLTKTARTQNQTIMFFSDPFKLVPVNNIADIADKFTRNEILTSNEIRQIIGVKPSNDPKADKLINSNLNQPEEVINSTPKTIPDGSDDGDTESPEDDNQDGPTDFFNMKISDLPDL